MSGGSSSLKLAAAGSAALEKENADASLMAMKSSQNQSMTMTHNDGFQKPRTPAFAPDSVQKLKSRGLTQRSDANGIETPRRALGDVKNVVLQQQQQSTSKQQQRTPAAMKKGEKHQQLHRLVDEQEQKQRQQQQRVVQPKQKPTTSVDEDLLSTLRDANGDLPDIDTCSYQPEEDQVDVDQFTPDEKVEWEKDEQKSVAELSDEIQRLIDEIEAADLL